MDNAEARALERTLAGHIGQFNENHRFTAASLRAMHKSWLGETYEWAGEYRQVNVSKGDFPCYYHCERNPEAFDEERSSSDNY